MTILLIVRMFHRCLLSAIVLLGLLHGACMRAVAQPDRDLGHKPNVILIIADDMGWRDIGYNGSEIRTPTLDRLAHGGRILTHHYATPTCTPTRVGLFTGRYPSRFGVLSPAYGRIFDDDTVTLAEAMKASGYTTHLAGKWHMGSPPEETPLNNGFLSSYGYFAGQIDPDTHRYKTGERTWHRNDEYVDETGHATDLITDEALRVIRAEHTQPFFLYVAYSVPHYPLKEPEEWRAMYPDLTEDSRRWFAASVTHMDHAIGKIVSALESSGLRQETLLIFLSDNGGERSWHSETQYDGRYARLPHTRLGDNDPLRGWKGDCYEGAIRVPAFVNWPNIIPPGETDLPVHVVDWMPTLCALAGFDPGHPLPWDGQNIWPALQGNSVQTADRTFYWKTPDASAVRKGDWKLIVSSRDNHPELYDLKHDPQEKTNLADAEGERLQQLMTALTQVASKDRSEREGLLEAPK